MSANECFTSPGLGGANSGSSGTAGDSAHGGDEVEHRLGVAAADVADVARGSRRRCGAERRVHDVGDVGEVARLLAVAEDDRPSALDRKPHEARHHAAVLRRRVLTRTEHVEVPQRHGLEPIDGGESARVLLGGQLGHGVGGDRLRHQVFTFGHGGVGAVDRRRRSQHNAPDGVVARRQKHVQRARDVGLVRGERILHGAWHRGQRCEVDHEIHALNGVVGALVAAHVALEDLDVAV